MTALICPLSFVCHYCVSHVTT